MMFTLTRLASEPVSGVASVEPNGSRFLREKRFTVILGATELAKFALALHLRFICPVSFFFVSSRLLNPGLL